MIWHVYNVAYYAAPPQGRGDFENVFFHSLEPLDVHSWVRMKQIIATKKKIPAGYKFSVISVFHLGTRDVPDAVSSSGREDVFADPDANPGTSEAERKNSG